MSMPFLLFFPFKPCTRGRILITSGNIVIRHQQTATRSFMSTGDLIFYCKRHLYFVKNMYIQIVCMSKLPELFKKGRRSNVSKNIKFRFDSTQGRFRFPWHLAAPVAFKLPPRRFPCTIKACTSSTVSGFASFAHQLCSPSSSIDGGAIERFACAG